MFGVRAYFEFVSGGDIGIRKEEQLHELLEDAKVNRDTVMIGDRAADVLAARANGLSSIGILWGYGTLEELSSANPEWLLRSPGELTGLVETIVRRGSTAQPASAADGTAPPRNRPVVRR